MVSFGSRLTELLPHYLVMLVAIFGALFVAESLYSDLGFWASFAIVIVVAAIYPVVVRRLGVAPESWKKG